MRRLVLLVALVTCAKSASDLAPFPCAADTTCPGGLACAEGQCSTATLDATCTTGDDPTDCSVAAAGATCSATTGTGACEIPCNPACPTGRNCTVNIGSGVCLVDCTDPTVHCPAGTACRQRPFDNRGLCIPPGVHCAQVVSAVVCNSLCAPNSSGVTCPDNSHTCPLNATCNADSTRCTCDTGTVALDCSGSACGGNCVGGNYWCAPDTSRFTCADDLHGISGVCKCWNGTMINVSCNQDGKTCEDLCAGR